MDPLFHPMLHGHEYFKDSQHARDFGPIAPPPRKDQDASSSQQGELSADAETAPETEPAAGEKPKKRHKRHNRQRKRRHKGSQTEPKPTSDAVEQNPLPLYEGSSTPPDQRLQNPTFIQHILPKWLQKPINVTRSNFDGTHRFDYPPSLQHLHVMSHLHWPKAFAYYIVPELYRFNPRAYPFFPGRTHHKLLLTKLGEGGMRGSAPLRQTGQSWDQFIEEQAAAMKFGIAAEDLLEFRAHEQAWATWWAVRWAFSGRMD
jgi:hypothetical protein